MRRQAGAVLAGLLLVGCNNAVTDTPSAPPGPVMIVTTAAPERSSATDPRALLMVPCGGEPVIAEDFAASCMLVVAGGKRFLFGAPAGVAQTLSREDLGLIDAVLLFSLASRDIEGLDEVRRASWRAGRTAPLPVFGPDGVDEMVRALNAVHVRGDSLSALRARGRGFRDMIMVGQPIRLETTEIKVLTTGDVTVSAIEADFDTAGFIVRYGTESDFDTLAVWPCADELPDAASADVLTRPGRTECLAGADWPEGSRFDWPRVPGMASDFTAKAFRVANGRVEPL